MAPVIPKKMLEMKRMRNRISYAENSKWKQSLYDLILWPPAPSLSPERSFVQYLLRQKYEQYKDTAQTAAPEEGSPIYLFFPVSDSVLLSQVNCLLCIINFLSSPSLFLSPRF